MSLERSIDGSGPVRGEALEHVEQRRAAREGHVASGTLACPDCDAPVALAGPSSPSAPLACPACDRRGAVRDFLSLGEPTRPAHVEVRVVAPAWPARRARRGVA